MARISRDQRLANVHAEALAQFDNVQSALRDERLQCLQDRRFYSLSGAQWEGPLWDIYENKPRFEVNKIMLSVIRIVNEYRNNRITVEYALRDVKKPIGVAQWKTKLVDSLPKKLQGALPTIAPAADFAIVCLDPSGESPVDTLGAQALQ